MRPRVVVLVLAAALAEPCSAAADVIPDDVKIISATFEIDNIDDHPELLIVAFPFGRCGPWSFGPPREYFPSDAQHDVAEVNYEVLKQGRRYSVQKHCLAMQLYAFDAEGFVTERRTAAADIDWYRKKGYERTVILGFEDLKTTTKIRFIEIDPRVRASGVRIHMPFVLSVDDPVESTHDVFHIEGVEDGRVHIEGKRVDVTFEDGQKARQLYVAGERPNLAPTHASASSGGDPFSETSPDSEVAARRADALIRRRERLRFAAAAGIACLLGVLAALAARRRRRRRT